LFSSAGFAQNGGVVFPDGSVRYPNGRVVTRDGTVLNPGGTVNTPPVNPDYPVITNDGQVSTRRTNDRWYERDQNRNRNEQYRRNLPPGQAKKLYGAKSAREFAPGQQKKNRGYDNYYGNGKKHKGHKGKGHK
jgi:hypothetical protein